MGLLHLECSNFTSFTSAFHPNLSFHQPTQWRSSVHHSPGGRRLEQEFFCRKSELFTDDKPWLNLPRWKNLWAICAEDVGNYLRPSKQSRPAIGRLPNCSTNSRPGLNRIFLMVAAWLRLLGRILFQIWIQIFIQTNIFLFYFFSITSISNMFTYF